MLAERQRLAMDIHDTLAQGLSSQRMLFQAAERIWDTDPATARSHLRAAAGIAEHNLAEARRFVHDLAPADLNEGGSLPAALRLLAARESTEELTVRCRVEGAWTRPPARVESALLRIAQGALANVREHSGARTAQLTLTHLGDLVVLDVADNGRGFDPAAVPAAGMRGHGLPAIHARVRQLDGTLTIESAPSCPPRSRWRTHDSPGPSPGLRRPPRRTGGPAGPARQRPRHRGRGRGGRWRGGGRARREAHPQRRPDGPPTRPRHRRHRGHPTDLRDRGAGARADDVRHGRRHHPRHRGRRHRWPVG